jgi:hypothetical protein
MRRTIQTAETDAFIMADWAERFRPSDEVDGEPVVEQPLDDGEGGFNAQILMSALSILREDVLAEGKEVKDACLGIIGILEGLAHRMDAMETHLVRRLSTLELTLGEHGPDFTNIFDLDPAMAEEIRAESEAADYLPELDEGVEDSGIPSEVVEAFEGWKDAEAEGTWQDFVKVAGGPKKAKEYRKVLES